MKSLQNKIFLFFVLLLLVVQSIGLWTVLSGKQSQEEQEIAHRLATAKTIFSELYDSRRDYLTAFARTAAKDYGIKQIFNEDSRSLLVALNNHRKRIDADLVMTINDQGIVSGQLLLQRDQAEVKVRRGAEMDSAFKHPNWLQKAQSQAHLYQLNGALYQLSLSPIKVGVKTIGWVGFGFQIDSRLAKRYKMITGLETSFMLNQGQQWKMIASSAEQQQLSLVEQIIKGESPEQYIVQSQLITEFNNAQFGVAMYALRADLVEVLQGRWWQILILIALTLVLSLAGAYFIAASITKPIKLLVQQVKTVASGDYNQQIKQFDESELGQLAREFNVMQSAVLSREQSMVHLANHDPLTDLPNRNMLMTELARLAHSTAKFSIYHLNFSRLTEVNDTLGHDVGDKIIIEAATRLVKVPGFANVFHLGADEFILLSEVHPDLNQQSLTDAIETALETSYEHRDFSLQMQCRIGIANYPGHCDNVQRLLQMADTALHHTRRNRLQLQVYTADLETNTVERLSLMNDFKNAVSGEQLELHYQPKLDLRSGIVTHMEALVRWRHPTFGLVPPDKFIPIAEQTGQINALTHWVFKAAVDQYRLWLQQGIDLNIAVNISAQDLRNPEFFDYISDTLKSANVPANKLTLEVTESAVVEDPKAAIAVLQKFKDLGFCLSIDDYGTGYSSLAQLKQLPVHELKIDRSFVQKLESDNDDQIIVRSTIELAHNMGLTVVAEGIEDEFVLNWLAEHGCEKAQGYFISRPQPIAELNKWLQQQKGFSNFKQLRG
ncbi:MAG: EAL domain-containing protein [Pseudomonadales bacterium]|nr:EAL domain-containing protein [Pseudomonadales bacterium]NRA15425.1 EAL domain-containing protein [Oceanospirillaceae bacterium]